MKKILLFTTICCLSSCSLSLKNEKRNEEYQYYSLNERNKPIVQKSEIFITKVTKFETLTDVTEDLKAKYQNKAKPVGSWDFSQKPSKTLQDEILNKAIDLGSNYIVMFEKKNCDTIDLKRSTFETLEGVNCYKILYYYLSEAIEKDSLKSTSSKAETLTKFETKAPEAKAPEIKAVAIESIQVKSIEFNADPTSEK